MQSRLKPTPPRTTRAAEIRKQQSVKSSNDEQPTTNNNNNTSSASATFSSSSSARQQQLTPSASANAATTNMQLQSFEAILSLMKTPATCEQFDRHASQLASLLPHLLAKPCVPARLVDPSSTLGGLPALLTQVAEVVSTNEAAAVLGDSLVQLLELASFPIQCSTLHDQRAQPSCVVALLEAVSHVLREPHTLAIRTQAATVMRDIIRRVNDRCGTDLRMTRSKNNNKSNIGGGGGGSNKQNGGAATTTGSGIQDLRAAVTKRSVLALADAWRASIERELSSTIEYARNTSSNGAAAISNTPNNKQGDAEADQQQQQQQQGANNNSSHNNNNNASNVTVEGIGQQLQQRDAALEVVALLQALNAATSVRARAKWLLEAGADQLLFGTLKLSCGDPRTALCIELIWNLLQLCKTEASFFATRDNYEALQNTLRITVMEGHVTSRRELRNDILVVFGLLTDAAPDSQCVSANLVHLVLELACGVELGFGVGGANASGGAGAGAGGPQQQYLKNHHTTRNEDMQLKILGWDLLRRWCVADEELAEIAFSSRYLDALLCYVDVTCENTAVVAWSTPQLLELQEHSLRTLEELVRVGCSWFCAARGPTICVSYVLECPAKPASLLQHAISLLAEAASSPARKLVVENGAIPLALRLLSSVPLSRETIERHVDCLTLVADLVDRTDAYQAEFANNNGVDIVMPLLKGAVDFADLGDELMLAAVDCVWGCVLGFARNEARFCELGGVGALLAVLDTRKILEEARDAKAKTLAVSMMASKKNSTSGAASAAAGAARGEQDEESDEDDPDDPVKSKDEAANFPLACVADLLLCPGAADLARKWRSATTGRSGMQVLLSLWKMQTVPTEILTERCISEDTAARFDVGCAVLGKHTRNPLPIGGDEQNSNNNRQQQKSVIPTRTSDPSYVSRIGIVVPPSDVRNIATTFRKNLKVFAAVGSIGYHGHHELELEERATLTTIQQFVALCKDEVWETVSNSLLSAGVEPTNADWETLRMLREGAEQRASSLQATRAAFAEMHRRQREVAEKTFYEALIKRTEERLPGGGGGASGHHKRGVGKTSAKHTASSAPDGGVGSVGGGVGEGGTAATTGGAGGAGSGGKSLRFPGIDEDAVPSSQMSITETKKLNKQMLKSSFKYPVNKSASTLSNETDQSNKNVDGDKEAAEAALKQAIDAVRRTSSGGDNNEDDEHRDTHDDEGEDSFIARWGVGQRAMSDDEYAVFRAINKLRTDPRAFISAFENALSRFDADAGHIEPAAGTNDDPIICEEGKECIEEAIEFLRKVRPLAVLLDVPMGMLYASRDFVRTAKTRMDSVADDPDTTPEKRMARYGKLEGRQMQLVSLGCTTAESVVVQLVLGDGNPERPDRTALFNPEFKCCSAAMVDHPVYKKVVQVSLAAGYSDKAHHEQKAVHAGLWSDF